MNFWSWFFLLLIFVPLLCVYVMAIYDIFTRPGMSGVKRAVWLIVVFVFPFVGTLVYLVIHGGSATSSSFGRAADDTGRRLPT